MAWTNNPILLSPPVMAASNDLFQAVCDELGNHYEKKGFKYSPSRPKITYKDKELKVVIAFWSSRSNTYGRHVNLEIIPDFQSLEVVQKGCSTIESKKAQGLIVGLSGLFMFKHNDRDNIAKVRNIYGDVSAVEHSHYGTDTISESHNCNIYGIDEFKFNRIVEFIDSKILCWIEKIKTREGILELIDNRPKYVYESLLGMSTNSDFVPYCNLKFPDLRIEERLRKQLM